MVSRAASIASWTASALRFGLGSRANAAGPRPLAPIELYEFEACPFCRKVREAATCLDLDLLVRPCPRRGQRFRPRVTELGGREQFPYMIDPNTDTAMYESSDIVEYMYARYGDRAAPLAGRTQLTIPLGSAASAIRAGRGMAARPSRAPQQPLELWGFESSPATRLVREVLCELELTHVQVHVGLGSPRRAALVERAGRDDVPWLWDPNRSHGSFDAGTIIDDLERTYGSGGAPDAADR
jgi:glutathione S-transferase